MTNASSPGFWEVVQYLASFTLVIALLLGFLVLLKRLQTGTVFKQRGQRLQVLESLSLGTRQRVVLVRVDQQEILLGVGGNEIQNLLIQPAAPVEQVDILQEPAVTLPSPLELLQRWRKRS
jgi:flagellar protein FliO/FliZ